MDSILGQTFADFEFVVIDDGSEDGSWEIITGYADPRIRRIRHAGNQGLTRSLNEGLTHVQGPWVARMDANDMAEPNRLERQVRRVQAAPGLVLLGANTILVDEDGREVGRKRYPDSHEKLVADMLQVRGHFAHSSAFFRTEVVRDMGGYNPRFLKSQDLDLWLRLAQRGQLGCTQDYLIRSRQHRDSVSRSATGGYQYLYALAARVCYLRRQQGLPDPAQGSQETWQNFLDTVADTAQAMGLAEALEARAQLRQIRYGAANDRREALRAIAHLLQGDSSLLLGLRFSHRYRQAIRQLVQG
jgi:glycosyltransferase involved in cell wall biosynthesis